jgi:hypothetical protein
MLTRSMNGASNTKSISRIGLLSRSGSYEKKCYHHTDAQKRVRLETIPGLRSYPRYYELRSVQNTSFSEMNCPDGYPEIRKILN